jgi:multicomponent Na+:H+ antiporter subunit F
VGTEDSRIMWIVAGIVLAVCVLLSLIRLMLGPTVPDRIVAIDTINTIVVVIMVVLGAAYKEVILIDVAIVYALLSFVSTLFIAKYIEKGKF